MPRRAKVSRRVITPDPKYRSRTVAKFVNNLMHDGKKTVAQSVLYDSFDLIEQRGRGNAVDVFELALRNATPVLEVKPRRVGGSTYQVPVEIRGDRRRALAMRWLIRSARNRSGRSMAEKLAAELLDASQNIGETIRTKENTHRMAEANRAFAHYRF
ncbi:MAG TPA: 30S ribosomal protein S7 [Chloroflexota bacterium]|nr:30S ribosomal protein S7 [Chloroflexota bacterium]